MIITLYYLLNNYYQNIYRLLKQQIFIKTLPNKLYKRKITCYFHNLKSHNLFMLNEYYKNIIFGLIFYFN